MAKGMTLKQGGTSKLLLANFSAMTLGGRRIEVMTLYIHNKLEQSGINCTIEVPNETNDALDGSILRLLEGSGDKN